MNKVILALATILFSINLTIASIPTVEGLFRNSNSNDLDGDLIVLKVLASVEKQNELNEEVKITERFYKLIFNQTTDGKFSLLQVKYDNSQMNRAGINETKYFRNFGSTVKGEKSVEKKLFYSLVSMFALNNSSLISGFLKEVDQNFQMNKEIMNEDKKRLYDDYKRYLQTIKEDETLKEDLVSPLKPEEEELKEKVSTTLKNKMYNDQESLSLIRRDKKFFWKLTLEKLNALFTNEEHRLVNLNLDTTMGMLKVECFDYISFNGRQEVPKQIFMTDLNGQVVKFRIVDYKNFVNKGKTIQERVNQYRKIEKENLKKKSSTKEVQAEGEVPEIATFPLL